jgi:predicted small secreted protein
MKSRIRLILSGLLLGSALLLTTGCENTSVGMGFSTYDSSTGMSYGTHVSTGPYGTHGSSYVGYSSGGYYGRPYYGRPYYRW